MADGGCHRQDLDRFARALVCANFRLHSYGDTHVAARSTSFEQTIHRHGLGMGRGLWRGRTGFARGQTRVGGHVQRTAEQDRSGPAARGQRQKITRCGGHGRAQRQIGLFHIGGQLEQCHWSAHVHGRHFQDLLDDQALGLDRTDDVGGRR